MSEKPAGYEADLGEFGPVLYDGYCGEVVGWGFSITRRLGETRFNALAGFGDLHCVAAGQWCLVTKWLTVQEAIEKYGSVTHVEYGPRGGFRSITFGEKRFLSKRLRPVDR